MNIFKEAHIRKKQGLGYTARRHITIWSSKKNDWNRVFLNTGIRRSDSFQYFPIWNTSHNQQRSLLFGLWLLYIEIGYYRNKWCYSREYFEKLPFQHIGIINKIYRLIL